MQLRDDFSRLGPQRPGPRLVEHGLAVFRRRQQCALRRLRHRRGAAIQSRRKAGSPPAPFRQTPHRPTARCNHRPAPARWRVPRPSRVLVGLTAISRNGTRISGCSLPGTKTFLGIGQRLAAVRFKGIFRRNHNQYLTRNSGEEEPSGRTASLRQHYLDQVQRVFCLRKTLSLSAPRTKKKLSPSLCIVKQANSGISSGVLILETRSETRPPKSQNRCME